MSTITSAISPDRRLILRPLFVLALILALVAATVALYFGTRRELPPLIGPAGNGALVTTNAAGDLVAVDPGTGASRTLAGAVAGSTICCADVSPDGGRVAFLRIDGKTEEPRGLAVVNIDGSGLRELDPGLATFIESLAWSPEGDRVLIANASGVVTLDVASGVATSIDVPFPVLRASWIGTTGDILLSQRVDEDPETAASIAVYRVAAGASSGAVEVARLDHAVDTPLVSPDGSKFAYFIWGPEERLHGRIHVFDFATGEDRAITPEVDLDRADVHSWEQAVWSPDSSLIASERFGVAENRVAILPASGDGAPVFVGPRFPTFTNTAIQFSPDGRSLVVTYRATKDTWLLPVDGSEGRKLDWVVAEEIDWQRLAP